MINLTIDTTKHRSLSRGELRFLVVHRLSLVGCGVPDDGLTGEDVIRVFKDRALGTGGDTPYHALVRADGSVDQMLPLLARGAHAKGYNTRSIGVAVAGNFDKEPMPDVQLQSLAAVCATLRVFRPGGLEIEGHTNLPDASSDPNKRCPGRHVSMPAVRTMVDGLMPEYWKTWRGVQGQDHIEQLGWLVDDYSPAALFGDYPGTAVDQLRKLWAAGHQKGCPCQQCGYLRQQALQAGDWADVYDFPGA